MFAPASSDHRIHEHLYVLSVGTFAPAERYCDTEGRSNMVAMTEMGYSVPQLEFYLCTRK